MNVDCEIVFWSNCARDTEYATERDYIETFGKMGVRWATLNYVVRGRDGWAGGV